MGDIGVWVEQELLDKNCVMCGEEGFTANFLCELLKS